MKRHLRVPRGSLDIQRVPEEREESTAMTMPMSQDSEESSGPQWGRLIIQYALASYAVVLDKESVSIGRSPSCDVCIDDPNVAEKHCMLVHRIGRSMEDNCAHIVNCSSFLMYCNSELVTPEVYFPIRNGDVIVLYDSKSIDKAERGEGVQITFQSLVDTELSEFAKKYVVFGEPLGFGASGEVRRCRDRRTGESFAVKIIHLDKFAGKKARSRVTNESSILRSLSHQNVVKIFNCLEDQKNIYIILELVKGGDLFARLREKGAFSEEGAKRLFKQILDAVGYLHRNNITHRDLKPGNILLSGDPKDPIPKITDFGVANADKVEMTTFCGTLGYAAPEIVKPGRALKYDKQVDMYALGIILYMILCAKHPDDDDDEQGSQQSKVLKFDEPEWKHVSYEARDLISHLTDKNPLTRLDVEGALKHPWLSGNRSSSTEMFAAPSSPLKKRAATPLAKSRFSPTMKASPGQTSVVNVLETPQTKRSRTSFASVTHTPMKGEIDDEHNDSEDGPGATLGELISTPPSKIPKVLVPSTGSQNRRHPLMEKEDDSPGKNSVKSIAERLFKDTDVDDEECSSSKKDDKGDYDDNDDENLIKAVDSDPDPISSDDDSQTIRGSKPDFSDMSFSQAARLKTHATQTLDLCTLNGSSVVRPSSTSPTGFSSLIKRRRCSYGLRRKRR